MTELIPVEASVPEIQPIVLDPVPEDPHERAQARLERLRHSFATTLALAAEMYRDEDWRYLNREDGTPYQSLAQVIAENMHLSMAMARRYVQGARDFYLPLSEVIIEGTRIEITAGDVAALGTSGMKDAVTDATDRLEGVTDPDEATAIISGSVQDTRDRKESAAQGGGGTDDDWDDRPSGEEDWDRGAAASGSPGRGGNAEFDDPDGSDWDPDDEWSPPTAGQGDSSDDEDSAAEGHDDALDPAERVLSGAAQYDRPESLGDLDEPLRSAAAALVTLAEMDPADVANAVTYDTRGVILPVEAAQANITRFRAVVETLPWFMARLGE